MTEQKNISENNSLAALAMAFTIGAGALLFNYLPKQSGISLSLDYKGSVIAHSYAGKK